MSNIDSPRIIIIDDNLAIHDDFKRVLDSAEDQGTAELDEIEAEFFGDSADDALLPGRGDRNNGFDITTANQGQTGYEAVKAAFEEGRPFSLAFVDMRMPPGWDGLVTIEHLWKVDPNLEVVICSAYSDHSWAEIDERLGFTDQLMLVKKPFDAESIRQVAHSLTRKWKNKRVDRLKKHELEDLVIERAREIVAIRLVAEKATAAKSEFFATVNHEVRTPMTVILGYAELLLANDGVKLKVEERIEGLEMICRNGEQLLELITEFLELTKIEGDQLRMDALKFSPADLAAEVQALMKIRADEKELSLRLEIADDLPASMISDCHRIRQILYVLINNAIRFTSRGEVVIEAHLSGKSEDPNGLIFDIRDSGVGISPDQLESLFEPFANSSAATHGRFGGTGLGVSLARKLARLLGGDLRVESKLGHGTCFQFCIPSEMPAHPEPSVSRTKASVEGGPMPTLTTRLLLVEDVRTNQMLISMVLKKAGATVDVADDGAIALEMIHSAAAIDEPYDLILMDMQMPVMDGWEVTRRLRAEGHMGPIFALTACTQTGDEERCIKAGCDTYFSKPLERNRLIRAIHNYTKPKPEQNGGPGETGTDSS